jgi:hypothetical protein
MNKVAFYLGLMVLVLGLIVWIIRPHRSPGKSTIKFLGFEFSFDTPAFTVMVLGIVLMVLSPNFPDYFGSPPTAPIKKIVCTGEHEENCPGTHDIYYYCGFFGSDKDIADGVCKGIKAGYVRLKTVSGNKCGYSLIEVTCM